MLSQQEISQLEYSREAVDCLKLAKHYLAKQDFSQALRALERASYSITPTLKAEMQFLKAIILLKQDFAANTSGYYGYGSKFVRGLEQFELFLKETEVSLVKQFFSESSEGYTLLKILSEKPFQDSSYEDEPILKANLLLARFHDDGRYMPVDYVKSFPFYQKASQKKSPEALHALGNFYYSGRTPVSKDLTKAAQYFKQAVDEDRSYNGQYYYDYAWVCEMGYGITKDQDRAIECYKRAMSEGHVEAHYRLGVLYAAKAEDAKKSGNTWRVDEYLREAIRYYEYAVQKNHKDAANGLGLLFYNQKKYATALKYFRKAAELGLAAGCYNTGYLHSQVFEGVSKEESLPKNSLEAVAWYRKAALPPHDYSSAQYALGQKYETGDLDAKVEKDLLQALEWYQKAAAKDHVDAKKKLEDQKSVFYALKSRQIVDDRLSSYIALEQKLKYCFKDPLYLCKALGRTAESAGEASYQRLEFLGDRVLNLAISDFLEQKLSAAKVGELQSHHSKMIGNKTVLPKVARDLGLERLILKSDTESQHEITDFMLADALEALIGALYRDGGPVVAQQFILQWWKPYLEESLKQSEVVKMQPITKVPALPLPESTIKLPLVKKQFTPRSQMILSQFGIATVTVAQFERKVKEMPQEIFLTQYCDRGDTLLHHVLRKQKLETKPLAAEKISVLFFQDRQRLALKNKAGETVESLLNAHPAEFATRIKSTLK